MKNKQQGASLVVALIMLTIITLVAVYSIEGSTIQSKMVASSLFSTLTYQECRNEQEANIRFYNANSGAQSPTLLNLVDEDTNAFNKIMDAFRLPKDTESDKAKRQEAIQAATRHAILTPFKVMETSFASMEVMKAMVEFGNPNSVTDAGVGALCARTAVIGAFLNVKINCGDCEDKAFVEDILNRGQQLVDNTCALENEIMEITHSKI